MPTIAAVVALLIAVDAWVESRPWQRAAVGEGIAALDPRPRPLRFGDPDRATAELVDVGPDRVVYRVRARVASNLVFPLRMRVGTDLWKVDGMPSGSRDGKLALDLPPGERELVMTYRPRFLLSGAATSAATVVVLGLTWWRREWR